MKMDIQIEGATESLNKCDRSRFGLFVGKACFVHNVSGNGAVNDLHHLA
jgi:hypothetical protein